MKLPAPPDTACTVKGPPWVTLPVVLKPRVWKPPFAVRLIASPPCPITTLPVVAAPPSCRVGACANASSAGLTCSVPAAAVAEMVMARLAVYGCSTIVPPGAERVGVPELPWMTNVSAPSTICWPAGTLMLPAAPAFGPAVRVPAVVTLIPPAVVPKPPPLTPMPVIAFAPPSEMDGGPAVEVRVVMTPPVCITAPPVLIWNDPLADALLAIVMPPVPAFSEIVPAGAAMLPWMSTPPRSWPLGWRRSRP